MGQHVLPGNPPITVSLRRSARARRLSLRVSRLDGRVTLTLPPRAPEREAIAFLRDREDWLRGHLAGMGTDQRPGVGGHLLFRGVEMPVISGAVRRLTLRDGALIVPEEVAARTTSRLQTFLKAQARDHLAQASDHYAAQLGRKYKSLTLRDTRSRWGSCSSAGALMYSWRLVMAPPAVLNYVAAHEVAHLAEMNHSAAFWTVVERLFPTHAECRRWLRAHGETLHRVRFTD